MSIEHHHHHLLHLDIVTLHCSLSQALRLYIYPYFRPMDVDPAAGSKDAKGKGGAAGNKKDRSQSPKSRQQRRTSTSIDTATTTKKKSLGVPLTEGTSDQQSLTDTTEERQRPSLQLQQLNTIIFGLPNLTFTP